MFSCKTGLTVFVFLFTFLLSQASADDAGNDGNVPTLMISLAGLRADKLDEFVRLNPDCNLKTYILDQGVKADYLIPSFPTFTFPNHFTMVTGLFMESHGIVGDSFYDPTYNQRINLLTSSSRNDPKWWDKAEPIWMTAKNQGLKTASIFWPGSEVWRRHPDAFLTYNEGYEYKTRCDQILDWYQKLHLDFGTLYFDEPDNAGKNHGPNSTQYMDAIKMVDEKLGYCFKLLEDADLLDKMNVIIVSDHGMANIQWTYLVRDYVNVSFINSNKTVYGIVSNIYPINENVKSAVYEGLKKAPYLKVYYKEELPKSFHYQDSERIAPIVVVAEEGYVLNTTTQRPKGNPGFDNTLVSMRAIFIARGPSFRKNYRIPAIRNVDVYPLLCEILKIDCHPHNGSLTIVKKALNYEIPQPETTTVDPDYMPKDVIPTLMISLDGFRADKLDAFLSQNPDSFLKKYIVDHGLKADYLNPSFPTLTFPNHFTLVTGLFMESHGIVGNSFYDPTYNERINLLSGASKNDPKWWDKAEPIWMTARNKGLKTASFFWAGSEVWRRHPDAFLTYNEGYEYKTRCDQILDWYQKLHLDFGTLYFDEPDHAGHTYGANSAQYMDAIKMVDQTLGYCFKLLDDADLLHKMNIIIVSDHGMSDMRWTYLVRDYVNVSFINSTKTVYGIVSNIHPINDDVKPAVYEGLKKAPFLKVYYKEELPKSFHFQNSERIAPIVVVAEEGYVLNTAVQTLKGNHGFDNTLVAMRAIFMASGPSFVKNQKIPAIKNVDVYPLLCGLLKLRNACHPNNGSLDIIGTYVDFDAILPTGTTRLTSTSTLPITTSTPSSISSSNSTISTTLTATSETEIPTTFTITEMLTTTLQTEIPTTFTITEIPTTTLQTEIPTTITETELPPTITNHTSSLISTTNSVNSTDFSSSTGYTSDKTDSISTSTTTTTTTTSTTTTTPIEIKEEKPKNNDLALILVSTILGGIIFVALVAVGGIFIYKKCSASNKINNLE